MKKIIIFLFIIIPFIAKSQMRERIYFNDLYRNQLKGNVKELKHVEYEPIYKSETEFELKIHFTPFVRNNYSVKFNNKGYLEEKSQLTLNKDSLVLDNKWYYYYDKKNKIKKEGNKYSTWDYEYIGDSITKIIQLHKTYDSPKYYNYTQKGSDELLNTFNVDSSYQTKILFVYDKYNRIIRIENYDNKEFIQQLTLRNYEDTIAQNPNNEIYIYTNGNPYIDVFTKSNYVYDNKNNPIKREFENLNPNKNKTEKYQYTYDKQGNWIEKEMFDIKNKLFAVIKREIFYYD